VKLGICLADDMGLGKTVQVIALLTLIKISEERPAEPARYPCIPASNWENELTRFAPDLVFSIAHPDAPPERRMAITDCECTSKASTSSLRRIHWYRI